MSNSSGGGSGGSSASSHATTGSSFTPFRRRSKSDSKGKRPSLITAIRNSINPFIERRSSSINSSSSPSDTGRSSGASSGQVASPVDLSGPGTAPHPSSMSRFHPGLSPYPVTPHHLDPYYTYSYQGEYRSRSRSGSGGSSGSGHGAIPRVFDIFNRNRSQSVSAPTELKAQRVTCSGETLCEKLDFTDLAENEGALVFVKFFKFYHCYDLIPISAKLIVFDTQLLVKKAFHALVSNGVRAAPLWDSSCQQFVGMLTITDFINILRNYYKSSTAKISELEDQRLETWRSVLQAGDNIRPLVTIGPNASLFDAIKKLIHNKVHRLPVVDQETGNVLYILTHKRILKFLFLYYYDLPLPLYLDKPISQLGIGTFENIAVTNMNSPLIEALDLFLERRVSALPVVDTKGKVIDIYAKFDVINLVAEKTYNNLDMTIKKALEYRNNFFEGVIKCQLSDTLRQVMEKIVKAEVHRIVVVDECDQVIGMISLSDILSFLTLKPVSLEREDLVTKIEDHALIEESGEDDRDDGDESDSDDDEEDATTQKPPANIMTSQQIEEVTIDENDEDVFVTKNGEEEPTMSIDKKKEEI